MAGCSSQHPQRGIPHHDTHETKNFLSRALLSQYEGVGAKGSRELQKKHDRRDPALAESPTVKQPLLKGQ